MKAIRIKNGTVAATFTLTELEALGYHGGRPSHEIVHALAEHAFSEICEHPKRIRAQAFLSDTALLLFAEDGGGAVGVIN